MLFSRLILTALVFALVNMPSGFAATTTSERPSDLTPYRALSVPSGGRALVLFDAPPEQRLMRLGALYATMLQNLLGHFQLRVTSAPVNGYLPGDINAYDAIFYLGSFYDNPIPSSFLVDVIGTTKPVVWFGYNLWKLAWDPAFAFTQKFGFEFAGIRGLDSRASVANPAPGFFDTVTYKEKNFKKFFKYDAVSDSVFADPDIGVVRPVAAGGSQNQPQVVVTIHNAVTGESLPYVLRSGNFWYVADRPFTYIGPRDRYLVLCDLLHDMLGSSHTEDHRALVRLEDVHPLDDIIALRRVTDHLAQQNIPYSIGVIPVYRDPIGVYNGGQPREVRLADMPNMLFALKAAVTAGNGIVLHGYSHQYAAQRNPFSGVTGEDYEFWDAVGDVPVTEDTVAWAAQRVAAGLAELQTNGLASLIWETPHYQASPVDYATIGQKFSVRYERGTYFTSPSPNFNPADPGQFPDFAATQFYPYLIYSDAYGARVIPENLGNISYGATASSAQEIAVNADYAWVVRDGFASFFYHPRLANPAFSQSGFADFAAAVDAITKRGYRWVNALDLVAGN